MGEAAHSYPGARPPARGHGAEARLGLAGQDDAHPVVSWFVDCWAVRGVIIKRACSGRDRAELNWRLSVSQT
jgi:hypothetical protein